MSASAPTKFRVLWGHPLRALTQEIVEAFDADEALVSARERRPDLGPPVVAFEVREERGVHFDA